MAAFRFLAEKMNLFSFFPRNPHFSEKMQFFCKKLKTRRLSRWL